MSDVQKVILTVIAAVAMASAAKYFFSRWPVETEIEGCVYDKDNPTQLMA